MEIVSHPVWEHRSVADIGYLAYIYADRAIVVAS
jgi:hypothetical protein